MSKLYKDENGMYYRFAGDAAPEGLTEVVSGAAEPSPSADSEAKPKKAKATRKAKSTKNTETE